MKDFSNYLSEKLFSCDGCSMKFSNEDDLTVHKKRHEMTFTISKELTFSDLIPTPTQLIRNCEAVGLFQDLQNVNPFDETFKKAVEAVKSGQPITLGKTSTNPPDDTLHTPKIFPHITDYPSDNYMKSDSIQPSEESLLKNPEVENSDKTCSSDITLQSSMVLPQLPPTEPTPVESIPESQPLLDNKLILNVPEGHYVRLLTPETTPSSCNMVVIKNSTEDVYPLTLKEKLKKTLNEKKCEKSVSQKVPILKCPSKRTTSNLNNKFSKFSKNAIKMISKLENSSVGKFEINETTPKKQKKEKVQSKESRSEFLARSRAASFRCREKKKMYVLYLEKVNNDLTTAYKNLHLINTILQKEISNLHTELLKHKNCSAADQNTEEILKTIVKFVEDKPTAPEKLKDFAQVLPSPQLQEVVQVPTVPSSVSTESSTLCTDPDTSFDVAEIILDNENIEDHEIPLNEVNKHPDIIVRFNSVSNDLPVKIPPDPHLDKYIEAAGDNVKQIYSEHCYYFKKGFDEKRVLNYKTFRETISSVSEDCKASENGLKNSDAFCDITSLNTKVVLEPRNPPPLILLKPLKKRSLQNKTEKT